MSAADVAIAIGIHHEATQLEKQRIITWLFERASRLEREAKDTWQLNEAAGVRLAAVALANGEDQ